uniref:Kazal-like domain-containing protein n=1 Tax=Ornithorhynchus anatinus TaxID=9258 RepID=A0A6I8N4Y4_ORNAN
MANPGIQRDSRHSVTLSVRQNKLSVCSVLHVSANEDHVSQSRANPTLLLLQIVFCCNSGVHLFPTQVDCSRYLSGVKGMVTACPRNLLPVCGSNDQTYNNECFLCTDNFSGSLSYLHFTDGN